MYAMYMASKVLDLVIFDLDGTLMDSMPCLGDWLGRAIMEYCPRPIKQAEIAASYGPPEQGIVAKFVPAAQVQACLDRYFSIYKSEHSKVLAYPGITELLKELRRRGIATALCTGKGSKATYISLDHFGWRELLDVVVTGDDTKNFKPDPEGINLILGRLGADPRRTLFIGDTNADLGAAKSAGVLSGWAAWGAPEADAKDYKADHHLASPQSVIALL